MTIMQTLSKNTSHTSRRFFDIRSLFILVILFSTGCASVNYVGHEFGPTTEVDIYYSEDAIDQDFELIGHGLGTGFWVKNRKIEAKLIDEAKEKGADAILYTGLGKSNILIGNGFSTDEKQMNVAFLRYKN